MFSALSNKTAKGLRRGRYTRENYSRTTHAAKITVTRGPHALAYRSTVQHGDNVRTTRNIQDTQQQSQANHKYGEECKRGERTKKGEEIGGFSKLLPSFYHQCSHPRSMYHGVPRALTLQSLDEMGTFWICWVQACCGRSLGHSRITNRSFMRVCMRSMVQHRWWSR
jgi:hypothetical protein